MSGPDFRSAWFASVITKHSDVTGATVSPNGCLVELERKDLPKITVAPLGNPRIDVGIVEAVLASEVPTVIVLVPKTGHYNWDARENAMSGGSTILTFKELYTFMHAKDPRPSLDKSVAFGRSRLELHSRVDECLMICESSLFLRREGTLSDITVAIEYEYEFSQESAVRAIARHPNADVILNANPNGRGTGAAHSYARDVAVPIFRISELMGALNYDGDQFRNYTPPERP